MGPESQIEFADFFSDDFEEILIALFARDEPFFMRVQGLMKPAYFRAMVRKRICRAILDHFSATSTFLGDLTHLLAAKSSESGENEETKTAIAAEVHRIQEMQDDDLETQRTECEKMFARFAQRSEFMVLLNEGGAKNPKYDIDKFSEKLRGVLASRSSYAVTGVLKSRELAMQLAPIGPRPGSWNFWP